MHTDILELGYHTPSFPVYAGKDGGKRRKMVTLLYVSSVLYGIIGRDYFNVSVVCV